MAPSLRLVPAGCENVKRFTHQFCYSTTHPYQQAIGKMEKLEVEDSPISHYPDSFTSLLSTLKLTVQRIALHTLAAARLILRLYTLPIIFAYRTFARRVTPLLRVLKNIVNSPSRTIRNLYRLYRVISSQAQIAELAESRVPSIGDAVSVESIVLKRLGVQEYHEILHEVRPGGSLEIGSLFPQAGGGFAPKPHQNTTMSSNRDGQPIMSPVADSPQDENGCRECVHERLGCVTCTQATRNSSVDTRIPRKAKSDSEFRPPPPATNEEFLKLPWRQVQAKKSAKLQKRVARY
jgi:hypothetical protein